MSSESLHESEAKLRPATLDRHRAISSLMEELEAVDWYDQRIDATSDADLAAVLTHNRDEEKEHAAMVLEWLRRHDPVLDGHLRTYLFTAGSIVAEEAEAEAGGPGGSGPAGSDKEGSEPDGGGRSGGLAIGALRDKEAL